VTNREVAFVLVALLAGFTVGSLWMYKHLTCAPCQRRWRAWKRALGLKMIE